MTAGESLVITGGTFIRSAVAGLVVVAPLFLIDNNPAALAVSNLLGILLLFLVGTLRALDRDPVARILSGVGTSLIGIVIATITVVLGG
jgi:VIT1/CCC1 family predicted Fe2+/Mn2+ transporter